MARPVTRKTSHASSLPHNSRVRSKPNSTPESSLFNLPPPSKSYETKLTSAASIQARSQTAPNPAEGRFGTEEKHARIEAMTNQALAELGEALAAGRSERLTQFLTTMSKFHSYSWGNVMLIMIQAPGATHVAGFHKWKQLDRAVKKGEHGIMILAPVLKRVGELIEKMPDGSEATKPIRQIVNTKPVYVFDVSQTEGKELPRLATISGEIDGHTNQLKAFIASKNIILEYASNLGGALGVSQGGKIACLEGLSPAEEFHVLVHEAGHELLHRGERRKETNRRTRELEAEAVAFVVCAAVGLDAKAASTDYIHLYQGDAERLAESLHFIRAVANEILTDVLPNDPLRTSPHGA